MVAPQWSSDQEFQLFIGTVIAVQANFYQVRLDSRQDTLLCTRPTRLKKIGQSVLVGDRVTVKSREFDRGAIIELVILIKRHPSINYAIISKAKPSSTKALEKLLIMLCLSSPPTNI
jgi:putative ribosome biogenesis GTPase RsgA